MCCSRATVPRRVISSPDRLPRPSLILPQRTRGEIFFRRPVPPGNCLRIACNPYRRFASSLRKFMSTPHPFVYLALALLFGVGLLPQPAMAELLVTGRVLHMTLRSNPDQQYLLYLPTTGAKDAPIFVSVHGISRTVEEHATRFAPYAERYRVVLVAPYFPKKIFPDYQRLGRVGQGDRADQVLQKIVTEVGELTGAHNDKLYLFGYSGGAQFVHRYMLAFPERVAKLVSSQFLFRSSS